MGPKIRSRLKTSPEYISLKQEKDMFKRRMSFLAFFTKNLQEVGADAILVGGEAIELYTGGTFATADIDLVVSNKPLAEKLLNRLGFENEIKNFWFNRDLNIIIQIAGESYSGDTTKLRKFKVKEYELRVAAPEDLIVNRLYSAKFWKSKPQTDLEQATALLKIFSDSIDNNYLDEQAKRDDVVDVLAAVRKYASQV